MANIRRDEAQLIITIDAKESAEYQKILSGTSKGVQDIKKLEAGTKEYNKVLNEQAAISKKLAQTDYTKLSIKQIQDRRAQLVQLQRTLPGVTFAEAGFEKELQRVNTALAENAARTRAVSGAMKENARSTLSLRSIYAAGAAVITGAAVAVGTITARFQKYSSVLKIALGTQQESDKALQLVKSTAAETTFTVDELTASYVKFANRGIRLTKDEMISLADLAASQGKSFDQLTEAILDAQTGEFERLKEFGIRASKSGDEANISFKGFNTTAKLTPEAIKNAFIEMGKLNGVTGANAAQMTDLGGRYSNFRDVIDSLLVSLGNSGVGAFFGRTLAMLTDYGKKLTEIISPTKTATDETRQLQTEFNNEIGVLRRLAPEAEGRKELIAEINEKYKDYLPNLIKESDSIDDITRAQKLANDAFEQKILLLVLEENLEKTKEKRLRAERLKQGAAISRARGEQENQNLGGIGATPSQLQQQKELSKQFVDVTIEGSKRLIEEATKEEEEYIKAAESRAQELGSTLKKIRDRFGSSDKSASGSVSAKSSSGKTSSGKASKEKQESDAIRLLSVPTLSQVDIDIRTKQLTDMLSREQAILKESYLQGKLSLEQYEVERLRITSANLATRIELLDAYGQRESDKRRELNIMLLETDKALFAERAAQISELENAQLTDLENMFANRLISEEEYNLSRISVQLNFYDEQLRLLEENGLTETDVYKKILDAKLQTQINYNDEILKNEKRTADLKKAIQQEGIQYAQDIFSLGAELLKLDEKERKKHANAIKKFETAAILVNSLAEISQHYKKAAETFDPITAVIVGTAKSIATGIRAGIAIAKVKAQQFYTGGQIKSISGQRITEQPNINALPGGDNVLIAAKPGEVVLNEQQQARAGGADFFRRIGVPGFNTGGIVLPNTTPTFGANVLSSRGAVSTPVPDPRVDDMIMAVHYLTKAIPEAISKMNIKTHVVYSDLHKTQKTVNEIEKLSSY